MDTKEKTYVYDPKVSAIHRLRVNVKSLAAEAKLIRHEERRAGYQYQTQLVNHRTGYLRTEARYTQLALAYARGQQYEDVEPNSKKGVDTARLAAKLSRFFPHVERKPDGGFGPTITVEKVYSWVLGRSKDRLPVAGG